MKIIGDVKQLVRDVRSHLHDTSEAKKESYRPYHESVAHCGDDFKQIAKDVWAKGKTSLVAGFKSFNANTKVDTADADLHSDIGLMNMEYERLAKDGKKAPSCFHVDATRLMKDYDKLRAAKEAAAPLQAASDKALHELAGAIGSGFNTMVADHKGMSAMRKAGNESYAKAKAPLDQAFNAALGAHWRQLKHDVGFSSN